MTASTPDNALIWAVHRTQDWWKHVGNNLGFAHNTVVTDRRGIGDRSVSDDFYTAFRRSSSTSSTISLLSEPEVADVIARCRVLRWLPRGQAERMARAMAETSAKLLDTVDPDVFLCFPIDNYVSDVIARLARKRAIPTFEVTASAFPGMTMLMHRGRLITSKKIVTDGRVTKLIAQMTNSDFTPSYIARNRRYNTLRLAQTFAYFRARGVAFSAWSRIVQDPLRYHLLEAKAGLGYKPRLSDLRIGRLIHHNWRARLSEIPRERRVLFALQLIPEAAIDYWIEDLNLVRHEDMLVASATALVQAGYTIVVKDHPLQFGFRQVKLLDRLLSLPGTIIVPYHVSGNEMIAECDISLTATGTLGLQTALAGNISIVGEAYYETPGDFVTMRNWEDCARLPEMIASFDRMADQGSRQRRIVEHLSSGSFDADFSCWQRFRGGERLETETFARTLGERIRMLGPSGEDWHQRRMPIGGGRHPGSPLD